MYVLISVNDNGSENDGNANDDIINEKYKIMNIIKGRRNKKRGR